MPLKSLSLRALLIASTTVLAPSFAQAQTEAEPQSGAEAESAAESDLKLKEVVVLGRYIPEVLRSTSEVAAFLAPEDLARQGDSDAAAALARVTGINIAEGKFVYVRGLGERYSSARLNGSPLPSPEPLQRVVPLDLFPTKILENILVQKTYSVEYPAEFGGGIVDLRTLNIPQENFLELSVSGSYNTETTAQSGLTHYGSETDPLGFDNGTRKLPAPVRRAMAQGSRISDVNYPADIQHIGQSFTNAELRLLQNNDSIPANGSYSVSGGRSFDIGGAELGMVGVLSYSNEWRTKNGIQNTAQISEQNLIDFSAYDYVQTDNNIGLDGLFGMGLDLGDDKINWTNLYIRKVTKQTSSQEGFDGAQADLFRTDRTAWYERELYSTQVNGRHFRGPWTFDWRTALSQTRRDAPYESATRFGFSPLANRYIYGGGNNDNRMTFSYLDDKVVSGAFDVEYVQPLSSARDITYSAGIEGYENTRKSQSRAFSYFFNASDDSAADFLFLQQRPDFLFANFNINPDRFVLREVTAGDGGAAYDADLNVFGAYAKVDAEIIPLVRAAVGLRYEDASQNVTIVDLIANEPLAPDIQRSYESSETYVLPAGTVTWNFAEDQQLRFGASQSIGRPQFRELAPQQYYDPDSDRTFIGNPYLVDTEFLNLDARYEYYFDRGQTFSFGVFFKELDKPVESVVVETNLTEQQTYINAPKATLMGFEVEFKKVYDSPFQTPFLASKEFLVQANYTNTSSELKVSQNDVVFPLQGRGQARDATDFFQDGEQLTGVSEHIANVQLGWKDEDAKSQGTLLATYASERVTARGPSQQPDLIQEPGVILDFVYKKGFGIGGRDFNFDFKVNNILGEQFYEYQQGTSDTLRGLVIRNQYDLGTTISLGLSAEF